MSSLLGGVLGEHRPRRPRPLRGIVECGAQRHHGMPVLARIEGQLLSLKRALAPPRVERMLEHVPALAKRLDLGEEVHSESPLVAVAG